MKRLLRNKANFGILEGFLSELLNEDITIDHILEGESNKQTSENKLNRVDMLVQNSKGELIIIEIQGNFEPDYLMRMVFGTSKLMVDNLEAGMQYRKIKKIISINIVYFDLGHGEDYIYHGTTNFKGVNKEDVLTLSARERALFHTDEIQDIYPEYYIIKVNNFDDVSETPIDEWINFLKNEVVADGTSAKGLNEAREKLNILKLSKDELKEYERDLDIWRDNATAINDGVWAGRMEGKLEGQREIARNCLKQGLSIETTATLTGLSEEEVRALGE